MTEENIEDFNSDEFDVKQLVKYGDYHLDEEILRIISSHPSVVYSLRSKPVIVYGMLPIKDKEAHVWMIPTKEFQKNKTSAIRHIKKVLADLKYTHNVHKAVTQHNEGLGETRWLEYLGFQRKHTNQYVKEL